MRKLIYLSLFRWMDSFTNHRNKPKEEAERILYYLLLKNDTDQAMDVWNELNILFKKEMTERYENNKVTMQNLYELLVLKGK